MEHNGPVVESYNGVAVMECISCGWKHQVPLPDVLYIDAYYAIDTFYKTHSPGDWFDYLESQSAYWSLVYADYLDMLATYANKPIDEPLTLLDVGCGSGLLLHVAMHKGWQGTGIEPSPQARARAAERGVYVVPTLEGMQAQFDAAALILVLEHVLDPLTMLRAVRERLNDGGACLIVVPHDANPLQGIAQKKHNLPAWWVCSPHVNYWNPQTLQRAMERAGFALVDASATFPVEQYLLARDVPYVGNEEMGRAMYREKMAFEMALYQHGQRGLLRGLQHAWLELGIGREIVMVGVKR